MAEKATVARPYARAVFELARDNDALTEWSKMLVDASLVSTDDRVESLFTDPRVSTQQLADLITGICGDGLNELGQNFIRVLSRESLSSRSSIVVVRPASARTVTSVGIHSKPRTASIRTSPAGTVTSNSPVEWK